MRNDTAILAARKLTGARCRCPACGEHFNATSTFDAHRVGSYEARHCLTCTEMAARGWHQNAGRFWMTPNNGRQTFAHRRISGDRDRPATTPRGTPIAAPAREARRQRDRARLETAWRAMTRGAA